MTDANKRNIKYIDRKTKKEKEYVNGTVKILNNGT